MGSIMPAYTEDVNMILGNRIAIMVNMTLQKAMKQEAEKVPDELPQFANP